MRSFSWVIKVAMSSYTWKAMLGEQLSRGMLCSAWSTGLLFVGLQGHVLESPLRE